MSGIIGKLVAVAIRQLAKPISLTIKSQAIQHPRFRKSCIYMAQKLHTTDIRLRTSLLGQKGIKVRPLNDRKAIEDGATFLAEGFVFSVAGSIVLYEAYRTRKKSNQRTEAIEDDIKVLQSEIEYLKEKLSQSNMPVDDYQVPQDLSPKILTGLVGGKEEGGKKTKIEILEKELENLRENGGKAEKRM